MQCDHCLSHLACGMVAFGRSSLLYTMKVCLDWLYVVRFDGPRDPNTNYSVCALWYCKKKVKLYPMCSEKVLRYPYKYFLHFHQNCLHLTTFWLYFSIYLRQIFLNFNSDLKSHSGTEQATLTTFLVSLLNGHEVAAPPPPPELVLKKTLSSSFPLSQPKS